MAFCMWKNLHSDGSSLEKQPLSIKTALIGHMEEKMMEIQMPALAFANQEKAQESLWEWFFETAASYIPFYGYCRSRYGYSLQSESKSTYALLLAREEGWDGEGGRENAIMPDDSMSEALLAENGQTATDRMEEENKQAAQQGVFVPAAEKSVEFQMEDYRDFEKLRTTFYVIDSTTKIGADQLNLDVLLGKDMKLVQGSDKPQILIYHTHSQEGFADSIPGDVATTIMGAGEKLAALLRDEYGFSVMHHTGQYDIAARDYAYSNAEPALEQILAENPSIEVIIDLHRDEVVKDRRLVIDLNGRPTAMFMFFNGLSRTRQRGDIAYLHNPYVNDNLAFSFQMQIASNEYYPGITRKIYLKGYRYNMHYRPKSLLIELGAQTNTVEEILNACNPLAHILAMVLNGEAG